ncbi:MAG: stage V sporulation protein AC [Clostridia bacterium]|jgi:stage V sporulation protein AC|nr:stage V sporulation protein AC [Clostridia bacterium]MCI2000305.1 stage V sporulation protein AC [Clostridia bacterium]MCI2015485.1 stage V sporulation protein AC [Clostridia bacterium]
MKTTEQEKEEYLKKVDKITPNSPIIKNCIWAFCSGGLICTAGEGLFKIFESLGFSEDNRALLVNIILIGTSAILTGLGLYSKLGKRCGAGTIIPITGFANSMVSPSIEFKKEGFVLGLGAKMFSVAGPVIVYGLLTSIIVGAIHYFLMG